MWITDGIRLFPLVKDDLPQETNLSRKNLPLEKDPASETEHRISTGIQNVSVDSSPGRKMKLRFLFDVVRKGFPNVR